MSFAPNLSNVRPVGGAEKRCQTRQATTTQNHPPLRPNGEKHTHSAVATAAPPLPLSPSSFTPTSSALCSSQWCGNGMGRSDVVGHAQVCKTAFVFWLPRVLSSPPPCVVSSYASCPSLECHFQCHQACDHQWPSPTRAVFQWVRTGDRRGEVAQNGLHTKCWCLTVTVPSSVGQMLCTARRC